MCFASKSSFRDPNGFIFYQNGQVFRKINPVYFETYRSLKEAKVFETLQEDELLIEHRETEQTSEGIVIQPKKIPFVSHPYE